MSERKVINKYFPADFDPSKIPRRKMGKDRQETVRLMAPFSMRCTTCGEYIYKGKKFNARKETVQNEEYYGIKIFRFYIKCTQCSTEITFKTDPKNSDYSVEHGAARNFEPWRDDEITTTEEKLNRLEEEENNPMQALENKSIDSKREMEILDALQELKTRNARIERASKEEGGGGILDRVSNGVEIGDRGVVKMLSEFEEKKKREEEEDEEEIRKVFGRAYLAGVPDIELEGANGTSGSSGSESEGDSPSTPKDGDSIPTSTNSTSKLDKGKGKETTAVVKRKLDIVEPTPADLLSAASKSIVAKSFGPGASSSGSGGSGSMAPPKKKSKGNSAMAKLMGLSFKK